MGIAHPRRIVEARFMLTWEQARSCVLARTPVLSRRRVRLEAAAGRVLAEPLIARNDSPPFDLSAVDGFAVHPKDVAAASDAKPVRLRLAGVLRAGRPSTGRLGRGTAIKILTGAPVPRGAGAVVMQEYCREEAASVEVCRPVAAGENIRPRGGEFRKGRKVLPSGTSVTPPVVGLLAAFGYTTVFVHEQPVVTIVVTGDELLSPSQQLKPGKIRDANSYALAAAVRALGIEKCRTMRLTDRPALLKRQLADALSRSDVLLAVGGMSVGDCDYVRPILGELGVRQEFWRVAVKPGKPVYFGLFPRLGRAGIRERDGGQDARPPGASWSKKAGRDARPPRGRRGSARPP
ncbi:MAG: molybdopterin molybdotransferase MoeA, partial [Planctomycetes bacterium]|nr:molybdopterin molybdotransferase MoeA [Planctomycetota bacterium]